MKKIIIVTILIFSQNIFSQIQENYLYFDVYDDYVNNNPMQPEVLTYVKEFTSNAILIDSFIFKDSNKTAKKERLSWALSDGTDLYMSMYNAPYIYQNKTFAKFSIIGKKFMVILLDEKNDRKAIGANTPYGGSVVGSILNMKPKSTWKDKNGNSFKILFIDKDNLIRGKGARVKDVFAYLLDTKKVIELNTNAVEIMKKLRKDEYYVEDFIEFVNNANK